MSFQRTLKFNPYHDKLGRFTTSGHSARTSSWQLDAMAYSSMEKQVLRDHNKSQKAYLKKGGRPGTRYDTVLEGDKLPPEALKKHLELMATFQRATALQHDLKYGGIEDFVLGEGKFYEVPAEPPKIQLGEAKQCFSNAANFMMEEKWVGRKEERYKYVEGYVMDTRLPLAIHHAWVVDTTDNSVIDPTLGWSPTAQYMGVEFSYKEMAKHLLKNKYYGLLTDGVRPNPVTLGQDPDFQYKTQKEESEMFSKVMKFNPNHYPAGTAGGRGGQFAPSKNKATGGEMRDEFPAGEKLERQKQDVGKILGIDPDDFNQVKEAALRWTGNMEDITEQVSEEEYQRRKERLFEVEQKILATSGDEFMTVNKYSKVGILPDPDRQSRKTYTAERLKLHDEIFTKMMRTGWTDKDGNFHRPAIDFIEKNGDPTVIHLGGRAGAGKSFLSRTAYDGSKFFTIDSDEIKKMFPEYDDEAVHLVHEESSYLSKRIMRACRRMGVNIVSDKTMGKVSSIAKDVANIKKSKFKYHQRAEIITVPRAISMMRAMKRWLSGGRFVPTRVQWGMTGMEDAAEWARTSPDVESTHLYDGFTKSGKIELYAESYHPVRKWSCDKILKYSMAAGKFESGLHDDLYPAWSKAMKRHFNSGS